MADNKEIIKCPACDTEMVKVFMPKQGINLDVCVNGCGGIYFDNREFSKFDTPHEDISPILEVLKDKEFKKVDESITRKCPVCNSNMVKNFASPKHQIQVDECYACGGKFLDYKELDKIRTQYPTEEERAADVMKMLYDTVGIDTTQAIQQTRRKSKWKQGALYGLIFGLILSGIFIYKSNKILAVSSNSTVIAATIGIAAGICLICTGLGALFFKSSNN